MEWFYGGFTGYGRVASLDAGSRFSEACRNRKEKQAYPLSLKRPYVPHKANVPVCSVYVAGYRPRIYLFVLFFCVAIRRCCLFFLVETWPATIASAFIRFGE